MSEPAEGPGTPLLGGHRAGYRRLIGAHRAPGTGGPSRGYLFTVALLAGTASMPILAAFSAGSATVGNSALPDSGTAFIPTPSVGPLVIPLPSGSRPPVGPTRTPPLGPTTTLPPAGLRPEPAAPALPDDADLCPARRPRPAVPRSTRTPPTTRPNPSDSRNPEPTPTTSPDASPPPTGPAPTESPAPSPGPTAGLGPR